MELCLLHLDILENCCCCNINTSKNNKIIKNSSLVFDSKEDLENINLLKSYFFQQEELILRKKKLDSLNEILNFPNKLLSEKSKEWFENKKNTIELDTETWKRDLLQVLVWAKEKKQSFEATFQDDDVNSNHQVLFNNKQQAQKELEKKNKTLEITFIINILDIIIGWVNEKI